MFYPMKPFSRLDFFARLNYVTRLNFLTQLDSLARLNSLTRVTNHARVPRLNLMLNLCFYPTLSTSKLKILTIITNHNTKSKQHVYNLTYKHNKR